MVVEPMALLANWGSMIWPAEPGAAALISTAATGQDGLPAVAELFADLRF